MADKMMHKTDRKRLRPALVIGVVLILLGVVVGCVAVFLAVRQPRQVSPITNQAAPASVKPKPEEVAQYQVAPDLPKYINIPAIHMSQVRIFQLGLGKGNKIATPDNIFDAGWYKASAKPGQDGAMFIYGHLSNWESNGSFYDLHKLKPGDTVTVTRGDNRQFTYKVTETKTYPADSVPMDTVLAPTVAGQQGLNLMTCAGKVIKGTNDFTERLVVYTSLVRS